ncbi:hypothetical protein [Candidatus Amarolinea dominans]|uniref:hypothetical protein n=1 Tax=Candidatus Amarolinea dominans TaxID=3140696 RepID=UPI003134819B|nr:hypothetical protein [Anaerolineae bacterium]
MAAEFFPDCVPRRRSGARLVGRLSPLLQAWLSWQESGAVERFCHLAPGARSACAGATRTASAAPPWYEGFPHRLAPMADHYPALAASRWWF